MELFKLSAAAIAALALLSACENSDDDDDDADEVVYSIAPPSWLIGTWTGTSDEGTTDTADDVGKLAIVETADISFGDYDLDTGKQVAGDLTSFASIPMLDPNATFTVLSETDTEYSYTIEFGDTSFTDTYELTSDTTLDYTFEMGGAVIASFEMTVTPASTFLLPPAWLQTNWGGTSSDETTEKFADVTADNIVFGDEGDAGTNFADFLDSDSTSTFKVLVDDGITYSYELSSNGISFTDTYVQNTNPLSKLYYTVTGVVEDQFVMEVDGTDTPLTIAPPDFLLGTWTGLSTASSDGDVPKVAMFKSDNIIFGDYDDVSGKQLPDSTSIFATSFDGLNAAISNVTETASTDGTDGAYEYTITTDFFTFTDTYDETATNQVDYAVSGALTDSFTLTKGTASTFLVPPTWLQGRWEGASTAEAGVTKYSVIGTNDIEFGDIIDGTDDGSSFAGLLGFSTDSTFTVLIDDDEVYSYEIHVPDIVTFTDVFVYVDDETLNYSFFMDDVVVDSFTMTLQTD